MDPTRVAAAAAVALGVAAVARRFAVRHVSFTGAAVLVTGGSRGFGLALARRFAQEQARLAIVARDPQELAQASADLRRRGAAEILPLVCDVRDPAAVDRAVAEVLDAYGGVDVLVNNAGVIHVGPFVRTQDDDFRDSIDTHFWAPLNFIRACLPSMRGGGGRIVNIASVGGVVPVPHLSAYCAGKYALVGLSDTLRMELAPLGISVTTVAPFVMRTGSHRNAVVRGQHAKEAALFALGSSTRLTSMDADAAARQVVEAARARRARVSPGWQSHAAQWAHHLAPGLTAAIGAWAATFVLPGGGRSSSADEARTSRDLDLRPLSRMFPTQAAVRFNQPVADDERP